MNSFDVIDENPYEDIIDLEIDEIRKILKARNLSPEALKKTMRIVDEIKLQREVQKEHKKRGMELKLVGIILIFLSSIAAILFYFGIVHFIGYYRPRVYIFSFSVFSIGYYFFKRGQKLMLSKGSYKEHFRYKLKEK